jgi:2-polyprenyl-3-methyl-5-hydroxy-6-metoxy-1,4-benzoquinol methylase
MLTAEALSPSRHEPGLHADLLACRECGAIQQAGMPAGSQLHDLYRDMRDEAYLAEQAGRRATAARLLDLIARHAGAGRLLDVGCGHGLLLDEARRRGHEVVGLELSRAGARHAREVLGLEVHEVPLEAFEAPGGFDVVVLADVLEHLEDPVLGIDRAARLLAPGGVLCIITPDASSLTARLAGARWWGYLPAHTCLIPRRTLRELLAAAGLVVSTDVPLVRTFSARRWLDGLGERLGPLGGAFEALAARLPPGASLSLSLYDERVVLAHRVAAREPAEPLLRDRGGAARVHVVLPAHDAADALPAMVGEMARDAADHALLVDDASADATADVALAHGLPVLRHPAGRGHGSAQKTGYLRALLDGADVVVTVRPDDGHDPALLAALVEPILAGRADLVVGSRLPGQGGDADGVPRWRRLGRQGLTTVENRVFGLRLREYDTGYRAFSADLLRSLPFLRNSDAWVFDQEIFAQAVDRGARVVEIPLPARELPGSASRGLPAGVRHGLGTLVVLGRFSLDRRGRRWPLLGRPATRLTFAGAGAGARGDDDAAEDRGLDVGAP